MASPPFRLCSVAVPPRMPGGLQGMSSGLTARRGVDRGAKAGWVTYIKTMGACQQRPISIRMRRHKRHKTHNTCRIEGPKRLLGKNDPRPCCPSVAWRQKRSVTPSCASCASCGEDVPTQSIVSEYPTLQKATASPNSAARRAPACSPVQWDNPRRRTWRSLSMAIVRRS